ncbi:MAG: hypothetical protein R3F62_31415 [Planctomycetota bacterium]
MGLVQRVLRSVGGRLKAVGAEPPTLDAWPPGLLDARELARYPTPGHLLRALCRASERLRDLFGDGLEPETPLHDPWLVRALDAYTAALGLLVTRDPRALRALRPTLWAAVPVLIADVAAFPDYTCESRLRATLLAISAALRSDPELRAAGEALTRGIDAAAQLTLGF